MAITEYNYIPTYTKLEIDNKPKDIITASYWNGLFNSLSRQGDHTAEELGKVLNHFTAVINEVKGIADGKYVKPTDGIPKIDLAAAVQASLDKADTALQTHQSLADYRTAFAQDVIDTGLGDRIEVIEGKEAGWDAKQDRLTAGDNITITENGTISSTGGGAKLFVISIVILSMTEVVSDKTYAEIKAAIDAGDIICIKTTDDAVYTAQVGTLTGTADDQIELLWVDNKSNSTLCWDVVVHSKNTWDVTVHELINTDRLSFELNYIDEHKVDKITGKGLSTNDYTYTDKAKVDAIPENPKYTDTLYDDTVVKKDVSFLYDTKQDKLIAGDNITIAADGKTISAIGGSSASIAMRVNGGYIQYSTDNGNTWSNLIAEADLKGDKGDTGATGSQGPKGDKGDTGPQGLQGPQGVKGDKGDTGPQGPSGVSPTISLEETASGVLIDVTDATGTSTAYVLHGDKGDKGDTGLQGPQGPKGEKGDAGPQGSQGPKGDKGDTGPQGLQGEKGPKGDTGPAGTAGSDGQSAYAAAQAGGYTDTQANFYADLAAMQGLASALAAI